MRCDTETMTPDVLVSGLRWTFWVLAYLFVFCAGALLVFGHLPAPSPLKWLVFAVVLWAIAEDLRQKLHPQPRSLRR
jgi:hypothetical protein